VNPVDSNNTDADATNVEVKDDTNAGDSNAGDTASGDTVDPDSAVTDTIADAVDQDTTIPVASWVDPATSLTWQSPPAPGTMTWFAAEGYCASLGAGWRLPSISEMRTILQGCPATGPNGTCLVTDGCNSYGSCFTGPCYGCDQLSNPTNPTGPGGGCYWQDSFGSSCDGFWWSGTNNLDDSNYAWGVDFVFGVLTTAQKMFSASVRCVQDAPGTWRDPTSGLTWQNPPSDTGYYWTDALTYCSSIMLGGTGWHVPTINELRTLIRGCDSMVPGGSCGLTDSCVFDVTCNSPGCYTCTFAEGPSNGCYWPLEILGECNQAYYSATERAAEEAPNDIWTIIFSNGRMDGMSKLNQSWVRCVK
jgi:hypothetical protein